MNQQRLLYWFTALFVIFYAAMPRAHAASLPSGWQQGVSTTGQSVFFGPGYQTRNTAQQGQAIWNAAMTGGATVATQAALSTASGQVAVVVNGVATAAAIFDIFKGIMGGPVGIGLAAITLAPAVIDWLGSASVRTVVNPDGTTAIQRSDPNVCTVGPCHAFVGGGGKVYSSIGDFCAAGSSGTPSSGAWFSAVVTAAGPTSCTRSVRLHNGNTTEYDSDDAYDVSGSMIDVPPVSPADAWKPATIDDIRAQTLNAPAKPALINELLNRGASIPISYAPGSGLVPVDGPAVISSPPVVTKVNDGTNTRTDTTTSQTGLTYGTGQDPTTGATVPTVTAKTTNNTVSTTTNNTTNNVVNTTTTTQDAAPPKQAEDNSFADTALPLLPTLYTPKYPNGLVGVWSSRKADLSSSPLLSLVGNLMPSVAPSGSCPSLPLSLNVGIADFGIHDVAPPCYIWDFAKWFILIGAALLCRALIFGG